jgi:HNH endonuclease
MVTVPPHGSGLADIGEFSVRPGAPPELVRARERFLKKNKVAGFPGPEADPRCPHTRCYEWQDALNEKGYGRPFYVCPGVRMLPHVYSHETFSGPVPPGWEVDHLCRNRACTAPDHGEAITKAEHRRRHNKERTGITARVIRRYEVERDDRVYEVTVLGREPSPNRKPQARTFPTGSRMSLKPRRRGPRRYGAFPFSR